ncbi:hypothetical protein KC326_g211 [Hortaea werneckii]|nr:hypothetical protein KC326_g211 [Hortaea werneckii]
MTANRTLEPLNIALSERMQSFVLIVLKDLLILAIEETCFMENPLQGILLCVLQHYRPFKYVLTRYDVTIFGRNTYFGSAGEKDIVIVTCFRVGANTARPEAPAATSQVQTVDPWLGPRSSRCLRPLQTAHIRIHDYSNISLIPSRLSPQLFLISTTVILLAVNKGNTNNSRHNARQNHHSLCSLLCRDALCVCCSASMSACGCQPQPSALEAVCSGSNATEVENYICKHCGSDAETAMSGFASVCSRAGVKIGMFRCIGMARAEGTNTSLDESASCDNSTSSSSSSSSSSASSTKAATITGTGSMPHMTGTGGSMATHTFYTTYFDSACSDWYCWRRAQRYDDRSHGRCCAFCR